MKEIILASQSPRRKQLLEWAEIPFKVVVRPTDEHFPADMPVAEVPIHIAANKALAVSQYLKDRQAWDPDQVILAADTIVVLGAEVINKPADRAEAIAILGRLSGKAHRVITGVVLLRGTTQQSFSVTTNVQFHPLSAEQIAFYVDKYLPYDKAGAYAIQEWIGVTGIASITGDFYNVMGLPVSTVVQALHKMGL
ncbi:MAG TPA: Maf family nucleotide pyrophosphatase [Sediminibacterium sp.]|nr:Maf family nucleotide pyrophosphatase [Sediminibacterium sp.]